jgi:hypothetical protein
MAELAVAKLAGTLLMTYTSHYVATKVYTHFCVPDGVWGFFQGMLTTGSPVCSVTLSYISNSQASYATAITMTVSRAIMDAIMPGASS